MALIFTHADSGARTEALKEMQVVWQNIYRTLGLRGALGDEALVFAGTLKSATKPNRLLTQEVATEALTRVAGSHLKSIVATGSWLSAVVDAVDRLDQDHRLRAATRIVHARFVATAILLRNFPADEEGQLLSLWEKVTFRIFGLGGANSRNKVGDYIRFGYEIMEGKANGKTISLGLGKLGEHYPIDKVLDDIDWNECYEGWSEEIRYLLFRYDEHLSRQAGKKLNQSQWNKIWEQDPSKSIEHIVPQSSGAEFMHHLGNLTMLPPGVNSSLQDKPPAAKAATYQTCGIKGTAAVGNAILAAKGWTKKNVLEHARLIEEFVRAEWA